MKNLVHPLILIAALGGGAVTAAAQRGGAAAGGQAPSGLAGNGILSSAARAVGAQPAGDPRVSTITAGSAGAARKLAGQYPAGQRASVERTFDSLLQGFAQVEKAVGVPHGDAAVAMAAFAIAAFEAHRDVEVDQAHYRPVIDQLRAVLQATPEFARAAAREKRELYEQMAIFAMFVAARRIDAKKRSDAAALAAVRGEAGTYITQAFQIEPQRLHVGSGGLTIRVAAGATAERAPAAAAPPSAAPGPARFDADRLAAVLFSWEQVYQFTGLQLEERTYLLFKDGTCTTSLPTALEDLDPAASRASHPGNWGRWRKRGDTYEVAMGGGSFSAPVNQSIRQPARRGERLAGTWSTASSGSYGQVSYWSNSSVTFGRDGRFEASSSGGTGGTIGDTTALSIQDDEGSASSISSPNAAAGGTRKSGRTRADRAGTYSIDGYTLTLRYDSGKIERHLFFASADRRFLFFRGSDMWKGRK